MFAFVSSQFFIASGISFWASIQIVAMAGLLSCKLYFNWCVDEEEGSPTLGEDIMGAGFYSCEFTVHPLIKEQCIYARMLYLSMASCVESPLNLYTVLKFSFVYIFE